MKDTSIGLGLALGLVLAGGTAMLHGGPLNPPAGPIASSYKTLTEVEPRIAINAANTPGNSFGMYRITQPGSYYLTGNISVPANVTWAVVVEAPRVTIDLAGFTIDGNGNQAGGILVSDQPAATIRNGIIANLSLSGISPGLVPTGSTGMHVENVRVLNLSSNATGLGGVAGIYLGRDSAARNCYVSNASVGIQSGYSVKVTDCIVTFARSAAFDIEGGSTIDNCVAVGTSDSIGGPYPGAGFVVRTGSTVTNCNARSNSGPGFVLLADSAARNSSATNNTGGGFTINSGSALESCTASSNLAPGVVVDGASVNWSIDRSVIASNSVAGVSLGASATMGAIRGSSIRAGASNGVPGIIIPASSADVTISGNAFGLSMRSIQLDGNYCIVTGNTFNLTSAVAQTAGGAAPSVTNMIGPSVVPGTIESASNPFANLVQ